MQTFFNYVILCLYKFLCSYLWQIYRFDDIYKNLDIKTTSISMDNSENEPSTEPTQIEPTEPQERKGSLIRGQFNWNLQNFDEENALKDFSRLATENLSIQQQKNNPRLYIAESTIKSMTLNKQHIFILRGQSEQTGKIELIRKYSDLHALREALVRRWPGCYIPPIPEKGNIGSTEKQVTKNKNYIVGSFLNRMLANQAISAGEEFQVFIKSAQNQVEKNLNALKPHSLEDLFGIYKAAWPQDFKQTNQLKVDEMEQKIKKFEDYFLDMKKDLAKQKDEIKRLAELRTKLTMQRYLVLEKTLPEYEEICLNWFNGKTKLPGQQQQPKKTQQPASTDKKQQDEIIEQSKQQNDISDRIYSNPKYQGALQAYRDELFPKEEGQNDDWLIYEMFKYELLEIEAMIQAITTYRYLANERRYYERNIEGNKQQLEDINNKKMSLKILLLSGNEDEKKTQLANETQALQAKFKVCDELWNALTQHVNSQLENFQLYRCEFYKKSLMRAFKKEAIYMAKLFNLYVEIHKL